MSQTAIVQADAVHVVLATHVGHIGHVVRTRSLLRGLPHQIIYGWEGCGAPVWEVAHIAGLSPFLLGPCDSIYGAPKSAVLKAVLFNAVRLKLSKALHRTPAAKAHFECGGLRHRPCHRPVSESLRNSPFFKMQFREAVSILDGDEGHAVPRENIKMTLNNWPHGCD